MTKHAFYTDLAKWWPLVSPVADYADEAAEFERLIAEALPEARTVLELGSGGGSNAYYLKRRFAMTLTDLYDEMLEVSRRLNPECEHVCGDMRTLALGDRAFDCVFIHDAIDYMTTEADLAAALATAYRYTRPGGIALIVPDGFAGDSSTDAVECGGSDGPDGARGEGIRFLEWSYDRDPSDSLVTTIYSFVGREQDGEIFTVTEQHELGVFPQPTWLRLLEGAGFRPSVVVERTDDDRTPRTMFVCRR
jgi:SAM-dependent methyltransferase